MAERSIAWTTNATGDGTSGGYSAANWQNMTLKAYITNPAAEGVLFGVGNNLAVTGASSPVAVNTGSGLVYGIWYENDASVNVTIPTPASNPRIDRVVLRANWSAQTVRITRIAGTEAASPSAPSLTQVANTTWDIPLYQVRITTGGVITLTDERTYVKHPGVYGWLNAALTLTNNLTVQGNADITSSSVGGNKSLIISNTDNTNAASGAYQEIKVGGGSAGDPYQIFTVPGATAWAQGIDNSDSDKFKLSYGGALGTNDRLTIDNSGNIAIAGSATISGAVFAASYDGNLNASQLSSGTVPAARITSVTADSIDDTMVGNRVPQFYRRQGGSATDWDSAGTSTYTPSAVRMQSGVIAVTLSAASFSSTAITFPTAFSAKPGVMVGIVGSPGSGILYAPQAQSITASGFTAYIAANATLSVTVYIFWLAIGTE